MLPTMSIFAFGVEQKTYKPGNRRNNPVVYPFHSRLRGFL